MKFYIALPEDYRVGKKVFAVYNPRLQKFWSAGDWVIWASEARTWETMKAATQFITDMGWENTTRADVSSPAYVVTLTD